MIIRSKTPLRIGLAGGGTDISSFADLHGGCVLNVTIDMYSYCTIIPRLDGKIIFKATDRNEVIEVKSSSVLEIDKRLPLHFGVYNRIVKCYNKGKPLSFEMITYSDAPAGSGLGTSSTMVVTIIKAFQEWLNIPFGEYDIAKLAYEIERIDLKLSGGKQDQYAATFGGVNFIEFYENDRVIVNPLRIKRWIRNEIENSLILYYTGQSRDSGAIIDQQVKSISNEKSLDAMFEIKKQTFKMKEAILKGEFDNIWKTLHKNWEAKKKTSSVISNGKIEEIYNFIIEHGAKAAKISGAGGGGYMMIWVSPEKRYTLIKKLNERQDGHVKLISFVEDGTQAWTIYEEDENEK